MAYKCQVYQEIKVDPHMILQVTRRCPHDAWQGALVNMSSYGFAIWHPSVAFYGSKGAGGFEGQCH